MAQPHAIVSDNGTKLTFMAMLRWLKERNVKWHYIAPGKPYQNGLIESFNARLIPTCMDHDPRAQLRRPMVMMRQGWSMSLFQASQQWSTMLS